VTSIYVFHVYKRKHGHFSAAVSQSTKRSLYIWRSLKLTDINQHVKSNISILLRSFINAKFIYLCQIATFDMDILRAWGQCILEDSELDVLRSIINEWRKI
jgi:hypothetical protein